MKVDSNPKTVYSSIQKTRTFYPPTNDRIFLLSQLSRHMEDVCTKARHFDLVPKKISFFIKTQNFEYASFSVTLPFPTNAPEILIPMIEANFDKMISQENKNTNKRFSEWGTEEYKKYGSQRRSESTRLDKSEKSSHRVLYRTAGVTLHELVPSSSSAEVKSQGSLFNNSTLGNYGNEKYGNEKASKFELIHKQIDSLEDKFGKKVVYLASTQNALKYGRKGGKTLGKNDNKNNNQNNSEGTDSDNLDRNLLFL